jgi:hypothetical protein
VGVVSVVLKMGVLVTHIGCRSMFVLVTHSECSIVGVLVTQSGYKCVLVTHGECSPNCWCACDSEWVWV